ncbi:hypothetical protein TWF694_009152 [Orbilia ellipsospora]|uniref:Uncharacterized protein n=1 Tax=Orbilia ellipsospora TaxID=2528407 RepID=A0AAV9XE14_9PEZI
MEHGTEENDRRIPSISITDTDSNLDTRDTQPPSHGFTPSTSLIHKLLQVLLRIRDFLEMLFLSILLTIPPIVTYFSFKPHYLKGLSKLLSPKGTSPDTNMDINPEPQSSSAQNLEPPVVNTDINELPPPSVSENENTDSELSEDPKDLHTLLTTNHIPLYNPSTKSCATTTPTTSLIPNEWLEIPPSIVTRLLECALESHEFVELVAQTGCGVVLYVLPDGKCEMMLECEEVEGDWVRVPDRVVGFLTGEVLEWVKNGGGRMVLGDEWSGVSDDFMRIFASS